MAYLSSDSRFTLAGQQNDTEIPSSGTALLWLFESFREHVCDCLSQICCEFQAYSKIEYTTVIVRYVDKLCDDVVFGCIFAMFLPETALAHDFAAN